MALTAVVLYVVFGVLGFGWRSWRQWRTTGSTGFRGVSGRFGSLEWIAGVGFVAAIATGVSAPLFQLAGMLFPLEVLQATWIQTTGIVLAVTGIGATICAQNDMGESWRIGVDPDETTTLVRHGVFSVVRNPIFSAMLVFAARHGVRGAESARARRFRAAGRGDPASGPGCRGALPSHRARSRVPRVRRHGRAVHAPESGCPDAATLVSAEPMLMNRVETALMNSPPRRRWLQRRYEAQVLARFGGADTLHAR